MIGGDSEAFDSIMRNVDGSSFVVTAAAGGEVAGCLVAFTTQCSMQPPRFGVWLSRLNRAYRVAQSGGALVVHLLRRALGVSEVGDIEAGHPVPGG